MDAAHIAFLATPEGRSALESASHLPDDRLTRLQRLRRLWPPDLATAIMELLELRKRARAKFSDADQMFFTPEGLEQSTGDLIANYRASCFPANVPLLDACCGIGGDAMALQTRGPVLAVDSNPTAVACTLANIRLNLQYARQMKDQVSIELINKDQVIQIAGEQEVFGVCTDVTTLDLPRLRQRGFGAAFFDPSRRIDTTQGRRRARNSEDYLPPLSWSRALCAAFPDVGVKVSPAIDDTVLTELTREYGSVEFISAQGECKEAVLWFGGPTMSLPTPPVQNRSSAFFCATVLRTGQIPATLAPSTYDLPPSCTPLAWLYEPDPAVIRAHLVATLCQRLDLVPLDAQIAYLTGNTAIQTPFATAYRVLDWMPFHLKNLQIWLRANQRRVEVVKRRGVPLEPEEMRKKLASPALASYAPVVLVLTHRHEQPIALLCDPPES